MQELKARLTAAPPCAPQCAQLAEAQLGVDGDRLTLTLDVHAAERVLVPLPLDDSALAQVQVRVDGDPAPMQGTGEPGAGWVASERGVHRLTLSAFIRGDRVALDFPLAPARLAVQAPGWTAAGFFAMAGCWQNAWNWCARRRVPVWATRRQRGFRSSPLCASCATCRSIWTGR